jgi:hypothetical protein
VYRSLPDIFRSWDAESIAATAQTNKRIVRQTLFLNSNYFHNVMLLHSSRSAEVPVNVRGSLEAAHDAINSFFMLYAILESEAKVWWVFNHRAFLEALCIGNILRQQAKEEGGLEALAKDPLFVRAKADICTCAPLVLSVLSWGTELTFFYLVHMIDIMQRMSEGEHGSEVAKTRVSVLSNYVI